MWFNKQLHSQRKYNQPKSEKDIVLLVARNIMADILDAKKDLAVYNYRFATVEHQRKILLSQKERLLWISQNPGRLRGEWLSMMIMTISLGSPDFDIIKYAEWEIENSIREGMRKYLENIFDEIFDFRLGIGKLIIECLLCKLPCCTTNSCCAPLRNTFRAVEGYNISTKIYTELMQKLQQESAELKIKISNCNLRAVIKVPRTWHCTLCSGVNNFCEKKCMICFN
jgi:hypothetical protein